MVLRRWGLAGLLVVAAAALWLLLAGPARLLGVDAGSAGMVLLVATTWAALYGIHRMPRGELDTAVSPGEWRAWTGVGFTSAAIAYFLAKADVLAAAPVLDNPDANAIGRNLVMLLIAWIVLASVLRSRWKNDVQEDERDREIERNASGWARGALTFCVIVVAVMLGLSPVSKLTWATPTAIANVLIFSLLWSSLIEYAVTAISYLRDRRA